MAFFSVLLLKELIHFIIIIEKSVVSYYFRTISTTTIRLRKYLSGDPLTSDQFI